MRRGYSPFSSLLSAVTGSQEVATKTMTLCCLPSLSVYSSGRKKPLNCTRVPFLRVSKALGSLFQASRFIQPVVVLSSFFEETAMRKEALLLLVKFLISASAARRPATAKEFVVFIIEIFLEVYYLIFTLRTTGNAESEAPRNYKKNHGKPHFVIVQRKVRKCGRLLLFLEGIRRADWYLECNGAA